ncbi:MAG: ATP-dependent DNA helicase RecG [Bacteroidetes bacterium]|nr:ATP-dependent DNA helicase RecG [Bacteroidota bacterium]
MTFDSFLSTEIKFLKGVGPERANALSNELNIRTFSDLLNHFPFRYVDRTRFYKIKEINTDMPFVQFKGKIVNAEVMRANKGKCLTAKVSDETGSVELIWFKGINWVAPKLKPNTEFIIFGKPTDFNGKTNIAHPEIEIASEENILIAKKLQPVYNTGEKLKSRWLDSKGIWKLQRTLVAQINKNIPETLSQEILKKHNLISREEAYKQIHLPDNHEMLKQATLRLKFDELFFLQLRLLQVKGIRKKTYSGLVFDKVGSYFNDFYNHHLPFPLTGAQKRVLKEIRQDMGTGKQMNRLLQGDVGSGKTIVALMSMLIALDNGFQACIMAPTEILANQHYKNLSKLLGFPHLPPSEGAKIPLVALLTGSTKKNEREKIHSLLHNGKLNILIGTHALIEEEVQFKNLGLVVIDEQHKFGVAQRSKLWKKSQVSLGGEDLEGASVKVFVPPHVLVMTATPIPRTLAMTLYGDLDVSVIDELPPGRTPVKTVHRYYAKHPQVFQFIKEQIQKGRQVYIVYPIIEESKFMDYKNLEEGFELIKKNFPPPEFSLGMVHGRLKPKLKEEQMKQFAEGKTNILVATTVIEVGVDVPNATLMVIESAERFGLSQLHQLRGRVGRGAEESFCILMTDYKISGDACTRMETMVRTTDGFEIAETDLRLRGPGDMSGTQQSGILDFKIADISKDAQLLQYTRGIAEELLKTDSELINPENVPILSELNRIKKAKPYWGRIS